MLQCNLAMHHLAVCKKSYSKLKIPFQQHWLSNITSMPVYSPIMPASIMLYAFGYPLCLKLCRHNWPGPMHHL